MTDSINRKLELSIVANKEENTSESLSDDPSGSL